MARKARSKPRLGRPASGKAMTAAERMRRMRERRRASGMKQIVRWVPHDQGAPTPYSSHRLLEARSLAMHAVIAHKISRDASLLRIPRNNLERWRARWSDSVPAWFEEWSEIMTRPWPEVAALITDPGENPARLRQSSPFAGVLTPAERKRIYDAFRA